MKKLFLLAALLIGLASFAQTQDINNYKYVIVPEKFDFLKDPNEYNLNTLTKMLFEKYGFVVFFTNDNLPPDLMANKCRALYGDLEDHSDWFGSGLSILLKDCGGKVIFESEVGKSKIKDYQKGYYEALRKASVSLDGLNYKYAGDTALNTAQPIATQTANPPKAVAATAATPTPVVNKDILFAQPIENGYQLVDTTPKVVLKMYRTSQQDSYTAVGDGKNGVVFKKGNDWFFEYYQNDKLISEKLEIKF
ncbi:hypothetical protein [Flavobacterium rhizosphaerae]|uniref:Uncharacterized protein n=1 Tax=Flavobacterium rhizosphaerae TaxID=3163298 RepID=A0ABW8Z200_9FLAO